MLVFSEYLFKWMREENVSKYRFEISVKNVFS